MSDPKAPRSRKLLWLVVLLLGAAGAVGVAVPFIHCPDCKGSGGFWESLKNSKREIQEGQSGDCPHCDGGRITILRSLMR